MSRLRFMRDYLVGLLRRVSRRGRISPYSKILCKRYFQGLGRDEYQDHFFAGNSAFFALPFSLSASIQHLAAQGGSTIVELGSGFGDLAHTLKIGNDTKYVGLDWSIQVLQVGRGLHRIRHSHHICGDAEVCPLADSVADLILMSNLTPYTSSLDQLATEVVRISKQGALIALLHPVKNPFWEEEFSGFGLNFFDSATIVERFGSRGANLVAMRHVVFHVLPRTRVLSQHLADYLEFERQEFVNE